MKNLLSALAVVAITCASALADPTPPAPAPRPAAAAQNPAPQQIPPQVMERAIYARFVALGSQRCAEQHGAPDSDACLIMRLENERAALMQEAAEKLHQEIEAAQKKK